MPRKTYVFSTEAVRELEKLRRRCKLSTKSNVIRLALQNMGELLDVVNKRKSTIVIRDAKGKEQLWHPLLKPAD